jgi:hypothetical protein
MTALDSNLPSFREPVLGYLVDLGLTERYDWLNRGFDHRTGAIQCTAACVSNHQYFIHSERVVWNMGRLYGVHHVGGRRVPCTGSLFFMVSPEHDHWSQLARWEIPAYVRQDIDHSTAMGQTYFYLFVAWNYTKATVTGRHPPTDSVVQSGHAALFVVNLPKREFFYYDPNGGDHVLYDRTTDTATMYNWYDDLNLVFNDRQRRPPLFLPGFTYTDVARRFPEVRLQDRLDAVCTPAGRHSVHPDVNNPRPPSGRCATATLLVLALCLRFNYGAPHLFDHIVSEYLAAFDGDAPQYRFRGTEFLLHATHWHRRLSSANSWDRTERALGLRRVHPVVHDDPDGGAGGVADRCGYVLHAAGAAAGVCLRRSCPHSVFCKYHRYRRFRGFSENHPQIYPSTPGESVLPCDRAVPWDRWIEPFRGANHVAAVGVDVDRMDADPHYRERIEAEGRERRRQRLS